MRSIVQPRREEWLNAERRTMRRTGVTRGEIRMPRACARRALTFQQPMAASEATVPARDHVFVNATTPGNGFPSSHSRKAPPAVET
jgi:hypothetical protein